MNALGSNPDPTAGSTSAGATGEAATVPSALDDADYARLLTFRDGLRRFLRWSDDQARAVGLTAAQHQLLLAIKGHGEKPSVGDVAEHLMLRHNSTVELVDRAAHAGLVERLADPTDHRVVRLVLTPTAERTLAALSAAHLEELTRLRTRFAALWRDLPDPPH